MARLRHQRFIGGGFDTTATAYGLCHEQVRPAWNDAACFALVQPFDIAVHLVCPGAVDTNLVNTLETPGVDRATKKVQRLIGAFRKIAQKPEQVVGDIISGIEDGRYLIRSSRYSLRVLVGA